MTDLAQAYDLIIRRLIESTTGVQDANMYYFACSGSAISWDTIGRAIDSALRSKGVSLSSEPVYMPTSEACKLDQALAMYGGNSRSHASRLEQMGWRPRESGHDVLRHLPDDVDHVLERTARK